MADVIASVLFFAGGVIAIWNCALWFEPRGVSVISLWPTGTGGMKHGGGIARQHYRWANGVPLVGTLLVLVALAMSGFPGEMAWKGGVIALVDPRGILWELVRELRNRPSGVTPSGDEELRD